jgi:hypothetical protein
VARFVVDQRVYQLVVCQKARKPNAAEVARFSLGGQTLVVVEDRNPDHSDPDLRKYYCEADWTGAADCGNGCTRRRNEEYCVQAADQRVDG